MTATPRELSDAIRADHDEILGARPDETRSLDRWRIVRTISGWTAFGVAITVLGMLVLSLGTGSLIGFILWALLSLGAPLLFIPAAIVWVVAAVTTIRIEAKRRERMFTLYGITVDYTIDPPVYSVGHLPASHLKTELHRTRAILTGDVEPVADEK